MPETRQRQNDYCSGALLINKTNCFFVTLCSSWNRKYGNLVYYTVLLAPQFGQISVVSGISVWQYWHATSRIFGGSFAGRSLCGITWSRISLVVTSGLPWTATTPLISHWTVSVVDMKVGRAPEGIFMLNLKVLVAPLASCVAGLQGGFT